MRGADVMQESLFTVRRLEDFVPADHPLRAIRLLVNEALVRMNSLFDGIYAASGRDSIAPEKLMRALLLQIVHSIRSERQLMEQLRYNLFRWFVGIAMDDPVWDHSVFSKNRDRLLEHEVVEAFFTPKSWRLLTSVACCPENTSPSMAPSSRPGQVRRASGPKTDRTTRAAAGAMPWPTGKASPAPTTRMRA